MFSLALFTPTLSNEHASCKSTDEQSECKKRNIGEYKYIHLALDVRYEY